MVFHNNCYVFFDTWKRIHIDSEVVQKPIIVHDTVIRAPEKPILKTIPIEKDKYQKVTSKVKIVYIPVASITKQKSDTTNASKGSKYTFTAPISQSAIGDNAAVTNNNYGPKQRHISDAIKTYISLSIHDKNSLVTMNTPSDVESMVYAKEIYEFMINSGFTSVEFRPGLIFGGDNSFKIFPKNKEGKIYLYVPNTPNVQQ